jgi:hypothetical protein
VIDVKEQSGYSKANVSGQNLSGSVPVIDLSRGGLKSAFAAFAAKEKLPLEADAKDNKAQNKPAEAKAEQPALDDQDKQPEAKNPDASRQDQENTAKKPATLEQTGYTPPQAFAPKFAPTIAAGALSMVQQKAAQRPKASYEDPDHETEADVFNLGKRSLKRVQKGILDEDSGGYGNNSSTKESDELMQNYAQMQQRQAFMQSEQFTYAVKSIDNYIERKETELVVLGERKAEVKEKIEVNQLQQEETQTKITTLGEQEDALKGAVAAQGDLNASIDKATAQYNRSDELHTEANALQRNTAYVVGNDVYLTVNENGKSTNYKVDENGQKQEVASKDLPFLDPLNDGVFLKKTSEGETQYVSGLGLPVSNEKKQQIDKALQAAGAKPEDVITDRDVWVKERAAAEAKAEAEGAGFNDSYHTEKEIEQKDKILQGQLQKAADTLKVPVSEIGNLNDRLTATIEAKEKAQEKLATLKQKGGLLENELKQIELKETEIQKQIAEAKNIKERMLKGEFKDMGEVYGAMSPELAGTCKMEAQANIKEGICPIPPNKKPNNTSRTNGSAAPPAIAASADVGDQFAAAAAGTPATANEPARVADKELVAAANAPKASTAPGMNA